MAWRPHGRASVDTNGPCAFAVCDRCSLLYNLVDLTFQMEWRGDELESTGFLVCDTCYDVPFIFNKPKKIPPDPVPVKNPRPQVYLYNSSATNWDQNFRAWDDQISVWDDTE